LNYLLSDSNRVDFVARAPLHAFTGWCARGLRGEASIDWNKGRVEKLWAGVNTGDFQTTDPERTQAMSRYFSFPDHPRATFSMTECRDFQKQGGNHWRTSMLGILDFVGVRRQLPVQGALRSTQEGLLHLELRCKWSFKAFGIKAPRLLFLTVGDIVDITAQLQLIPHKP